MHRRVFSGRLRKEYALDAMRLLCAFLLLATSAVFAQSVAGKQRIRGVQSDPNCSDVPLQQSATLGEVLKAACISAETILESSIDPSTPISSYAVLNARGEFLIAYYDVPPDSNGIKTPLHLIHLIRSSKQWRRSDLLTSESSSSMFQPSCLGEAVAIHRVRLSFVVITHVTPSVSCMLVVDGELNVKETRYGLWVAGFSSGEIVYEQNRLQPASPHPLMLALFDVESRTETAIYPPGTDPLRKEYADKLSRLDPSDRCQGLNCALFPELFEGHLMEVATNDQTHAFAFLAEFSPEGHVPAEKVKESEVKARVVYVYQLSGPSQIEEREFPEDEIKSRFGTTQLNELLTSRMLVRVFDR